eukprot:GFKZ01000143.1.p1 GENE.GFKZ01000143.1~~GFKZ01000143.1.p1  ORF type:complete len:1751 (+),score=210.27 GFKZ01000143.1:137-5389(+)
MQLDVAFARCVDHLSLAGSAGSVLPQLVACSLPNPRPTLVTWFLNQFRSRPHLFTSPDWNASVDQVVVVAHLNLRKRALGLNSLEQVSLPDRAFLILEQIGIAGIDGVLQSELATRVNLTPVVVSHYVKILTDRRLLVKRKVVLRNRKVGNRLNAVTYTAMIWLSRFSEVVEKKCGIQDGGKNADKVNGSSSQPDLANVKAVKAHTIDFGRGAERILAALRDCDGVMAQRDLKLIAVPDHEMPHDIASEEYNRKRHRKFRSCKDKLVKLGLVEEVKRECVSEAGKSRGVLDCLRLKNPETTCDADIPEAEGDPEATNPGYPREAAGRRTTLNADKASRSLVRGKRGKFLAEVDLVEQVYQLLRASGSKGMSVPELKAHLDGGCGLTGAPSKRLWNIIDGLGSFEKVVRSQRFNGSIMELTHVLLEFSNMADADKQQSQNGPAEKSQVSALITGEKKSHRSKLARKKEEMTTLGLQRQELVMALLNEKKAIIRETLGRKIAESEGSRLQRVDRKVMKRVLNGLVEQKRIQLITTIKPNLKESGQLQTVELAVLPGLTPRSPEVARALSAITASAQHGNRNTPSKKGAQKRNAAGNQAEGCFMRTEAKARRRVNNMKQNSDEEKNPGGKLGDVKEEAREDGRRKRSRGGKNSHRETASQHGSSKHDELVTAESADNSTPLTTRSDDKGQADVEPPSKKRRIVVFTRKNKDDGFQRIPRLTATLYGLMKGKMARVKAFHQELFAIATGNRESMPAVLDRSVVQHSSIETARSTPVLGSFEVHSCAQEMTVGSYAAIVGIFHDIGDNIEEIRYRKVREVPEIAEGEKAKNYAAKGIQSLTQLLVQLGLLVCQKEWTFSLCGAGILRNFGRGMPHGVFPHGIVFANRESVSTYWRELHQYSLCSEAALQQMDMDLTSGNGVKSGEVPSFEVKDAYFRSSWNKLLMVSYYLADQIKFEAALQRVNGVSTEQDLTGRYNTTNFVTARLRRFSMKELLEQVNNLLSDYNLSPGSNRSLGIAERLILYSRYRTENEMPEMLRSDDKIEENNPSDILRLNRGPPSHRPSEAIKSTGRPQRGGVSRRHAKKPDKPREVRNAQYLDVKVSLNECVSMLRDIVVARALNHCKKKGWMTSWQIAGALRKPSALGQSKNHGDGYETGPNGEEKCDQSCRRVVADMCACISVQVILECLSLKLAYRVAVERHNGCLVEFDFVQVCHRLQREWQEFDNVICATAYESETTLYSGCRVVFETKTPSDLRVLSKREAFLEREFNLEWLMRTHKTDSLTSRIQTLSERYRLLVELRMSDSLAHGFVMRTDAMDDVVRAEDDEIEPLRVELVEVMLMCILNEGRRAQSSTPVMKTLEGIRLQDITAARDRLVLRGGIKLSKGLSGEGFFEICTNARGQANAVSLKTLMQAEKEWRREIMEGRDEMRFRETKLGEAVMSENQAESMLGAMGLVKMVCGEGAKLNLSPVIGDQGMLIGYDGEQECETMLDMKVSYSATADDTKTLDAKRNGQDQHPCQSAEAQSPTQAVRIRKPDGNSQLVKLMKQTVTNQRGIGATLAQLIAVCREEGYTNRDEIVAATETLREGGDVLRVAIENKGERAWYGAGNVLFVGREFIKAWTRACGEGAVSVWCGMGGEEARLVDNVASRVVHLVRRRVGIGVGEVVCGVQERFGGLSGRAVADVVYALGRRGVLTVRRLVEDGGSRGVFGGGVFRAKSDWVESGMVDYSGSAEWYLEVNFGPWDTATNLINFSQ